MKSRSPTLLLFLLSASFILGLKAQDCQVAYYEARLPSVCTVTTFDDGEQREECIEYEPRAFAVLLGPEKRTITEPNLQLDSVDFMGDCDCTFRLYSGKSLNGCFVKNNIETTSNEQIYVLDVWKRTENSQSFTITCNF